MLLCCYYAALTVCWEYSLKIVSNQDYAITSYNIRLKMAKSNIFKNEHCKIWSKNSIM